MNTATQRTEEKNCFWVQWETGREPKSFQESNVDVYSAMCVVCSFFLSSSFFLLFTKTEFIVLHFFSFLFYISKNKSKKEQKKAIKKRNSKQNGNEEEFLSVSFKFRLYIFSFDRHKSHHSFFTSFFLSFFLFEKNKQKNSQNGNRRMGEWKIRSIEFLVPKIKWQWI